MKDLGMRRLPGGEAFVDLMKDGAGKQQILEHDPFLRPRFEENVLSLLPGGGEDKMSERKHHSQTFIQTRGLLKLRMQMPHLRFYCRHLQLSPGIRLQIELDVFMRDIEGIEAEVPQDARSRISINHAPLRTC